MRLRIEQDTDAESPATWGDDGLFLVANHRDFYVPEPKQKRCPDTFDELVERWQGTHWIFPIEAYIHSGVVLAFSRQGNFPDRQWDVSQVGAIFAAKSEWRLSKSARKAAESHLEAWNQYCAGDVWGCVIEDDEGNTVDSCWGFYGHEYAKEEGSRMLKYAEEHAHTEACNI